MDSGWPAICSRLSAQGTFPLIGNIYLIRSLLNLHISDNCPLQRESILRAGEQPFERDVHFDTKCDFDKGVFK